MSGAHLVTEMVCCGFGASCCSMVPALGAVIGGCYRVGGCLVVAKARAASVELFDMRIGHAAAANVAAFHSYNMNTVQVASEAPACEYLCNMRKQHAAAASAAAILCLDLNDFLVTSEAFATEYVCSVIEQHAAAASAAALRETFNFISIWKDVFESASLVSWPWLSGMVVFCAGFWNLFGGKVSSNSLGKEKIRFVQKDVKEPSAPSDLQALTREELDCFDDEDGELHLHEDLVDFKGKDGHDTDGSLSLGMGEASGRVDVPVSVKQLVDKAIRSPQSVVVNQSLRVEKKKLFSEGFGWEHLAGGKVVGIDDTMSDIGVGHDCTIRCTGRLRGGAQRFRQSQPDILGQWTAAQKSLFQVWVPEGS